MWGVTGEAKTIGTRPKWPGKQMQWVIIWCWCSMKQAPCTQQVKKWTDLHKDCKFLFSFLKERMTFLDIMRRRLGRNMNEWMKNDEASSVIYLSIYPAISFSLYIKSITIIVSPMSPFLSSLCTYQHTHPSFLPPNRFFSWLSPPQTHNNTTHWLLDIDVADVKT